MESLLAAEKNNEVVSEWPSSVFALLPPDSFFDSVIRIAVSISNMPYAVVMHNEQQGRRIVSSLGMDEVDPDDCMDLCATALNHEKFQEISDLSEESSCSDNSLVEGIPSLKFFKGIPLRVAEKTIGMLAVMHEDPNSLTALQRGALEKLVHVVDKVLQSYCKIPPLDRFAAAKIIEQDIYIIDASTLQILYHCACSNDKTRPIELRTLAGSMLDRLVSQDLIAFTGHVAPLRAGTHDVVEFESVFQEPGQQAKTVSLQVLADKGDDTGLFTVIVSPSADAQQRKVDLHGLVDSLPGAFIYRMHKSSSWITGYVSRGYHELTGRNPEEIIGSKIAVAQLIAHPEDKERAWNVICAALKAHKPFELTYRIVVVGSANELRWVREQGRGKYTESGQLLAVEGVVFDVTREQQHSTKLGYQASHDYLTGMCNRREFEHRLARALQNAKAKNSEHALCFLDLDQFKVVNDTCGHRAGDELLRKLNSVLNSVTRQRDTLARLGGDEFGILMEHCALQEARRVATMVRDGIRELEFNWEGKIFRVGVSIGIAMVTADIEDPTVLLQMADRSCYAAKRQGGNRIHVYQGDDDFPTYQDEAQWVSPCQPGTGGQQFSTLPSENDSSR